MKNSIYLKPIFALALCSLLVLSCNKDVVDQGCDSHNEESSQRVNLALKLSFEQEQNISRAVIGGETYIADNDLYLLCFDSSDKLAELPTQVNMVGSNYIVVLNASNGASRKIYVIANSQGAITSGTINWRIGITTLSDVVNGLLSPSRVATGATVINNNITIHPMYASTTLPSITARTIINTTGDATGQPLLLRRATAKITVVKDNAADHDPSLDQLQLQGINLGNTTVDTYLLETANTIRPTVANTGVGGNIETMLASADGSRSESLYSYQTPTSKSPYVVVKATFNGQVCFYRLDFVKQSGTGLTEQIPLLRNTHYMIVIKKVSFAGYPTASEAIAQRGSNVVLNYFTIGNADYNDVITNSSYTLSLTNSEYITFSDNYLNNLAVTSYAHNAPPTVVNGTATVSPGLVLNSGTIIPIPGYSYYWRDANVNILPNTTSGTLTIKVGDLSKEVIIKRLSALKANAQMVQLGSSYIQAIVQDSLNKPWIRLSDDGGVTQRFSINNAGNDLRICVDRSTGTPRTAKINLFKKSGSAGCSVIFIEQLSTL